MSSPIDRLDEVVRELKAAGFNIGVAVYRPPTPSSAGMVYNNLAMRGPYTHKAWLAGQALNDVLAALIDAHHRPNDVPLTSTRL